MKYLSICSGIEAASVAFEPLGWRPLAFSEIEAFPRAVLKHHYPDTPCHGDFTLLKDEPWIVDADMLCGGTPCQAFSVAGNRQSLADDRGNLTLQFVLLADAIDHLRSTAGREPAWILWENVPGVLSTHDNAFGAFLGGLVGRTSPIPEPADGWTGAGVVDGPTRCAAWRILDAQHFGLAQRRKRVFVLARGGAGRWAVADALLPIIESSEWHPAPSRSKGEGVAATITSGAANGGPAHGARSGSAKEGNLIPEVTRPLTAAMGTKWNGNGDLESSLIPSIAHTLRGEGFDASEDGTGRGVQLVPYRIHKENSTAMVGNGVARVADPAEVARCLDTCGGYSANQGGNVVMAYRWQNDADGIVPDEVASTLRANGTTTDERTTGAYVQQASMQVRRLSPVECERLQGFPDGYTNIPWRGKPESPDGPRYKALGNSWAVPCARWIGERIKAIRL
jgi:DNA (cytosine-5)-methyltransferase 1